MTTPAPSSAIRYAIAELPTGTSHGERPDAGEVYLPPSHHRALAPNASVVTGMRGAGKTFWWTALQVAAVRRMLATYGRPVLFRGDTVLGEDTEVAIGFGVAPEPEKYPGKDVLSDLLANGNEPRVIWKAVTSWHLATDEHPLRQCSEWTDRVAFVVRNPEIIDRLLRDRDSDLDRRGVYAILLFDALDRSADDWRTMSLLTRGLLQVALDLRGYRRIRAKVFLRSDQATEARAFDFPDASKLRSSSAELTWPRRELYGLFWHCLARGPGHSSLDIPLDDCPRGAGNLPAFSAVSRRFIADEDEQRHRFHKLTGRWMGPDPRRGLPYKWIPNHLGDANQRVSPRPFLTALRAAAADTEQRFPDHPRALHYDSIKHGVREASRYRVAEMREDYPWVERLLGPLKSSSVPCRLADIADRWKSDGVLDRLPADLEGDEVRLPPSRFEEGPQGVREDLEALGVFQRLSDGRVNIPDVFRVAYGIGRKGGVKPVR